MRRACESGVSRSSGGAAFRVLEEMTLRKLRKVVRRRKLDMLSLNGYGNYEAVFPGFAGGKLMGSMAVGPYLVVCCSVLLLASVLLLFERRRLLKLIKEEALAKSALGESIVRFHMILESSAAGMYVFRGGRFVMVNAAMESITGYSREELLAMEGLEHLHPDHRPAALERNAARERGEFAPTRYELKLLTKSGDIRWVDFTARTVLFDGEVCTVGSAFDITSRKKAEEDLKERERLWRTMVETSPDGIATISLEGVVASVSKRCVEMWGYTDADDLVGRHMLEFVDPAWHDTTM